MAEAFARALDISESFPFDPNRVTLPPPTQHVISLQAMQARRSFHPAFIALVATFFLLVLPLTLGFSFSIGSSSIHAPTALGASVQFVKMDGLPQGRTPYTQPTTTPTPTTTTTTVTTIVQPYSQPAGDGEQNHGSKGGHGHKHGHKHGH